MPDEGSTKDDPRPQGANPYAYGLADVAYSRIRDELIAVQAKAERDGASPAAMAAMVCALADDYIEELRDDPVIKAVKVGNFFNHYDDDLRRVEGRTRPKGTAAFSPIGCQVCGALVNEELARCFVCGNRPRG